MQEVINNRNGCSFHFLKFLLFITTLQWPMIKEKEIIILIKIYNRLLIDAKSMVMVVPHIILLKFNYLRKSNMIELIKYSYLLFTQLLIL